MPDLGAPKLISRDHRPCALMVPQATISYPDVHVLATQVNKLTGFVLPDGATADKFDFIARLPKNLAPTPNAKIEVIIMTRGVVSPTKNVRLTISTIYRKDTENMDVALTVEGETTVAMPTTTETMDVYEQALTDDPDSDDILVYGQVNRNPVAAADDFPDDIQVVAVNFTYDKSRAV